MSELPDRGLVDRARGGDATAVGALFSRYWRAARAAAFGVTGDIGAAEDAAAEAFRQALAGLDSLKDPERFGPWLRTIVMRKARQEARSRRAMPGAPSSEAIDPAEGPDEALERVEMEVLARQAVRELPDRLREAVSLFYIEGYDAGAAARFLAIPAGTFRRRLHDGRRRLRELATQILRARRPMNQERALEIERLKNAIANANQDAEPLYQALRGALALRPPAHELFDLLMRRQTEFPARALFSGGGKDISEAARELAARFAGPSPRMLDPTHPVGQVAAAIRRALPRFEEWRLDHGDAAARLFTSTADHRARLASVLPPGFAEGRPGAYVRATRGLVFLDGDGTVRTTYQSLQGAADVRVFKEGLQAARISDVLDLTWMETGPLDLRSVQEVLEHLASDVLPGRTVRFANYDEPRYRSALILELGGVPRPAACGGVLAEWPDQPQGVSAAHVRVFLEAWATASSGEVIEPDRVPGGAQTLTAVEEQEPDGEDSGGRPMRPSRLERHV